MEVALSCFTEERNKTLWPNVLQAQGAAKATLIVALPAGRWASQSRALAHNSSVQRMSLYSIWCSKTTFICCTTKTMIPSLLHSINKLCCLPHANFPDIVLIFSKKRQAVCCHAVTFRFPSHYRNQKPDFSLALLTFAYKFWIFNITDF